MLMLLKPQDINCLAELPMGLGKREKDDTHWLKQRQVFAFPFYCQRQESQNKLKNNQICLLVLTFLINQLNKID